MLTLAATRLPRDVIAALEESKDKEKGAVGEKQLEIILENLEIAKEKNIPICQDTGIPIFFIKMGPQVELEFSLKKALEKSIRRATESIPLRPNIVDPLTRKNSGDNTGKNHPLFHPEFEEGKGFEIELLLKGAGSENWSRLFMLNPTSSEEDIKNTVLQVVEEAGGQICPPSIIGIGIGGTAERASLLAKKSLLRSLEERNADEKLATLEDEITSSANDLGVGPMGLGGETTALGTRIESADCHTGSLPLAINFQCWAARRAKTSTADGKLKIGCPDE